MFIDVKSSPYNATGNGTTDDRAAFASADAAGGTVYVPRGTYRIASNLTLTSDVRFEQGARLKPDASVTVTLSGSLDAGVFQVFDIGNAGSHVFPKKTVQLLPQWWGATGDGSTDDYAAIEGALSTARTTGEAGTAGTGAVIFFPPGIYKIGTPLNCTAGQYNLRGSGQYVTYLRGNTGAGRAIVEFVGSTFSTIQGFTLDTVGMSSPSTVGVLLARIADPPGFAAESWFVNVTDCAIALATSQSANNSHGTVGVYNYGCEVSNIHNSYVKADTAVLFSGSNLYSLTSYHRPAGSTYPMWTGDTSMTVCTATGANGFIGMYGPALKFGFGANFKIDAYLSQDATGLTSPPKAAIEVLGQVTDFEYHGSIEEYPQALRTIALIRGLRLHAYTAYSLTEPRIWLDADPAQQQLAVIEDSIIDIVPNPESYQGTTPPVTGYLIDGTSGWDTAVSGSLIFLRWAKARLQNAWPQSYFNSNLVLADSNLSSSLISATNRTANVMKAGDGLEIDGPKLGLGNTATGTTLGSVVRKVQVYDASGNSLGYVPIYNTIT